MIAVKLFPSKFQKKIQLNYRKIQSIGQLPAQSHFKAITHLHLSNNQIKNLDGIQFFEQLKSLSLQNNLIIDINQFNYVSNSIQYLNVEGNPFLKRNYEFHSFFFSKFTNLRRLDGKFVNYKMNEIIQQQSDILSRWFILFIVKLNSQLEIIQSIISTKQIVNEINTQKAIQFDPSIKMIEWEFVYSLLEFLSSFGKDIQTKDLTIASLQIFLTNLNQCISSQISYTEILDANEAKIFKKAHFEAYKMLINHQKLQNFNGFIDFLLEKSDNSNYYLTFQTLQPPQSHVGSDLYTFSMIQVEQERKVIQQIPNQLKSQLNKGLLLQTTNNKVQQIEPYQKEPMRQYFPIYPFRLEYMRSIFFIIIDKINSIKLSVDQLIQIGNLVEVPRIQLPPSPQKLQANQNSQITIKNNDLKVNFHDIQPTQKTYQTLPTIPSPQHTLRKLPIKEQSISHANQRRVLISQYCRVFENIIESLLKRKLRNGFKVIKNQKNRECLEQISNLFLLRKVFDIFIKNKINKQDRLNRIYRLRLQTLAFLGLKINKQKKVNRDKSMTKIYKFINQKRLLKLIQAMLYLKDLNQQKQVKERMKQVRKHPSVKIEPEKEEVRIKRKNSSLHETKSIKVIIKDISRSKVPMFYDKNQMKTCNVCNYNL